MLTKKRSKMMLMAMALVLIGACALSACKGVACTAVEITTEEETFRVGTKVTFTAVLTPADTTDAVKWSSSDEKVATIDKKGCASLLAEGTTTITARAGDAVDQWMITVVDIKPEAVSVTLPTLVPGNDYALVATVLPEGADQAVTWSLAGDNASITSAGVLTVSAYGEFTLTAVSVADPAIAYTKTVKVTDSAPDAITINLASSTFEVGEVITPTVTVMPVGTNASVTWTVSDSAIASVSRDNTITFLSSGVVTITAYSKKDTNIATTVTVSVLRPLPSSITVTSSRTVVKATQASRLTATVLPSGADGSVSWSSSDEAVATVAKDGTVTFNKEGEVTITATSVAAGSVKGSLQFSVESAPVDPTTSYADGLTEESKVADILAAIISFINATYDGKTITGDVDFISSYKDYTGIDFSWSSSDTSILTDDGVYHQPVVASDVKVSAVMLTKNESSLLVSRSVTVTMHAEGWGTKLDALAYTIAHSLPAKANTNITLPVLDADSGATIAWSSDVPDVLSASGVFTKPITDTLVTLSFVVTLDGASEEGSAVVRAIGYTDYQIAILILEDYNKAYEASLSGQVIAGDVYLATETSIYPATIAWTSTNPGILNGKGEFTKPVYATTIQLTVSITVGSATVSSSFEISVGKTTYASMWDAIEMFLDNIAVGTITNQAYTAYGWESGYTSMLQKDYGFLYFYTEGDPVITQDILSVGGNRPGTKRLSTEFVTVHDTATGSPWGDAAGMNEYVHSDECVNGSKSWTFSVGNDGIYQEIPLDEVSYHAGDGAGSGSEFTLIDTGLLATCTNPTVTIQDGYWVLEGRISKVKAPTNGTTVLTTSAITDSGIFTKIGTNGHWFIANTYYNSSYGVIANHGGNRNSVSIETCVNSGSDYTLTMRTNAKLVAWLLLKYGLDTSRVVQHNYWSGKDCPMTMRHSGRWSLFLNMVNLEYFAQSELKGVSFSWKSLSPSILSNTGKVISHAGAGAEVNYQVTVTYEGVSKTYQFSSKLARLTF